MNKKLVVRYLILQQILNFIKNNFDTLKKRKQLPKAIDNLKGSVKEIDDITRKKRPHATKVQTKTKTKAKNQLVALIIAMCLEALEWAKEKENDQLIQDFSVTATSFRGNIVDVTTLAEYTLGVIETNKKELTDHTDITDVEIQAATTALDSLKSLQVSPSTTRATQKTINALYLPAFDKAKKAKETFENLVKAGFTTGPLANPQLILDLKNALIYAENVHHTRFVVTFIKAGTDELIEDALVRIVELDLTATSTISGLASISEFVANTYHVTFSAEGYITQTKIITFRNGEKEEITVELELEKAS